MFDRDRWEEILMTLTRNKTRSILTAFGVFWGVFMLVALIGGGNGMKIMMYKSFSGFATNSCLVMSEPTSEAYKGFRKGRQWNLSTRDLEVIKSTIKEVSCVSPTIFKWVGEKDIVRGEIACGGNIKGHYPDYALIEKPILRMGRFLNDIDIEEHRKVCVIGSRIYETLFKDGTNPLGEYIRIAGIYYQVIGVSAQQGGNGINIGGDPEERIILPFTTMQKTYQMGDQVHLISIMATKGVEISSIEKEVEKVIKQQHSIAPNDAQAIRIMNFEKMFKQFDNLFMGVDLLIWIVGLGTLFAGVIGVSNIMMVTVKERTAEIGIRRAIGAKPKDIMLQILSESLVLTFVAGMLGISFGVLILQLVDVGASAGSGVPAGFQISFLTAISTVMILLTMGTLSGLTPAFRAMSIKPIEAIRDE